MPPKTAAGLTENEAILLAIIKTNGGIKGIKWDEVAAASGSKRTGNAIRQQYQKMRGMFEKGAVGGADGAGGDDGGEMKPVAAKKKRTPAKTRKIEQVEAEEGEGAEDGSE